MKDTIHFHSSVNEDGVLRVQFNLGLSEAGKEVEITIRPLDSNDNDSSQPLVNWHEFLAVTYGTCADLDLKRQDQGEFEMRESIE